MQERQAALVGHPAGRIAMRAAPEAMIEALFIVDREAGRLFIMEGAAGLILAPGAGDLHGAADKGREGDARAQFVEPLRGEGHRGSASFPLPFVSSEVETLIDLALACKASRLRSTRT